LGSKKEPVTMEQFTVWYSDQSWKQTVRPALRPEEEDSDSDSAPSATTVSVLGDTDQLVYGRQCLNLWYETIDGAGDTIRLANVQVDHPGICARLRAARARGVKVFMVLGRTDEHPPQYVHVLKNLGISVRFQDCLHSAHPPAVNNACISDHSVAIVGRAKMTLTDISNAKVGVCKTTSHPSFQRWFRGLPTSPGSHPTTRLLRNAAKN